MQQPRKRRIWPKVSFHRLPFEIFISNLSLFTAIALSLKETDVVSKASSSSLYPSMYPAAGPSSAAAAPAKERRKVRALYDFEAAEDNELTFKAGEISKRKDSLNLVGPFFNFRPKTVHVIDDSDPNWWKGSNQRGEGLFPANFVSSDLEAEPEVTSSSKRVQFNDQVTVATLLLEEAASVSSEAEVEIDEAKIDRMLHALHEADPTGERPDPEDLKVLEEQCGAMGPLIDAELEKLDRRHAHLTKLSGHLVEALDMYRGLMRELPGSGPAAVYGPPYGGGPMKFPPGPAFPQPQAPPQSPSMHPPGVYQQQPVYPAGPYGPPGPAAPYVNPYPPGPPF